MAAGNDHVDDDASEDVGPPAGETVVAWIRRWLRSRRRYGSSSGATYWLMVIFQGSYLGVVFGFVIIVFGGLFIANWLTLGGTTAYDLAVQITSPWATPSPWLALPLSVFGWLVVTGFAGALAGYIVTEAVETRSIERQRARPLDRRIGAIPLLAVLQFRTHDFDVPDYFGIRFARRHEGDWLIAQDHWERVVERFLSLPSQAGGPKQIMLDAVRDASYVLDGMSGRCPICHHTTQEGSEDA